MNHWGTNNRKEREMGRRERGVKRPVDTRRHDQDTGPQRLSPTHRSKCRGAAKTRGQRNADRREGQTEAPEKELNETEISTRSEAEFKTLVTRMLREVREELGSTRKAQSEVKDTLIETENNLRRITVEWTKPRIKSVTLNIRKQNTPSEQQEEKRIQITRVA